MKSLLARASVAGPKANPEQEVECAICLEPYVAPIVLGCGHAFCRLCLVRSSCFSANGHLCALCRTLLTSSCRLREQPPDEALTARVADILATLDASAGGLNPYAARYAVRKAAHAQQLETLLQNASPTTLPVFYMWPGTRPGAHVALHLFEARYRALMRRVWEGERQLLYADSTPRAGGTAVLVRIDSVHFLADGRANIVGQGVRSVRISKTWIEPGTDGLYHARIEECAQPRLQGGSRWLIPGGHNEGLTQEQADNLRTAADLGAWCSIL